MEPDQGQGCREKEGEYAMLKEKRSKGDREARSKEKKERQKEAQRRYRIKMKEKKLLYLMLSLLLLLIGVCLRMNQHLNLVSPLLSPQSVSLVHNLAPPTPRVVPSTPQPGPSRVWRKQDGKTYMSYYRQNLSRQRNL